MFYSIGSCSSRNPPKNSSWGDLYWQSYLQSSRLKSLRSILTLITIIQQPSTKTTSIKVDGRVIGRIDLYKPDDWDSFLASIRAKVNSLPQPWSLHGMEMIISLAIKVRSCWNLQHFNPLVHAIIPPSSWGAAFLESITTPASLTDIQLLFSPIERHFKVYSKPTWSQRDRLWCLECSTFIFRLYVCPPGFAWRFVLREIPVGGLLQFAGHYKCLAPAWTGFWALGWGCPWVIDSYSLDLQGTFKGLFLSSKQLIPPCKQAFQQTLPITQSCSFYWSVLLHLYDNRISLCS